MILQKTDLFVKGKGMIGILFLTRLPVEMFIFISPEFPYLMTVGALDYILFKCVRPVLCDSRIFPVNINP